MSDLTIEEIEKQAKLKAAAKNAVVISNATELVVSVVRNLATGDVATTAECENLTRATLSHMVASSFLNMQPTQG